MRSIGVPKVMVVSGDQVLFRYGTQEAMIIRWAVKKDE